MKKIVAILAILMGLNSTAHAGELGVDKAWHFVAGAGIQGFVQDGLGAGATAGFAASTAMAVGKEAFDKKVSGGRFDPYDALATMAGAIAYFGGNELSVSLKRQKGGGLVEVSGLF